MEKGSGTTLHYIMTKNSAHDLVPPPIHAGTHVQQGYS